MNLSTVYYIWLSLGVGFCTPKTKYVYNLYPDVKMLYEGSEQEMRFCGVFSEGEITKLCKHTISDAQKIIDKCKELGITPISIDEEEYPEALREISDPPAVIYVKGSLPDLSKAESVAIVGTRKATAYGIKTASALGANLAKQGFVVVSGGALGIDCAAHQGVLKTGGVPVCVLGCGIDYNYLQEIRDLREAVSKRGALISEYPPGTAPAAHNFPQRNRIISALSKGVVVVEAPLKSGSMITVDYAIKQNKDVFAVMGNVDSPYSSGSNQLIKDGAIPTTCWQDVVEYYKGVDDYSTSEEEAAVSPESVPSKNKDITKHSENKPVPVHQKAEGLTREEAAVYYTIGNKPMHIDEIAEKSKLASFVVIRAVSSLELKDLIENTNGRFYAIK